MANDVSEKVFLTELAVSRFNEQYGRSIDPAGCTIFSIVPNYGEAYGYEIATITTGDNLRLRIYFSLQNLDNLNPYRLEVDTTLIEGALGVEVYVSLGTVNSYWLDSGVYKFRWIQPDPAYYAYMEVVETGDRFKFMNGQDFQLVVIGS